MWSTKPFDRIRTGIGERRRAGHHFREQPAGPVYVALDAGLQEDRVSDQVPLHDLDRWVRSRTAGMLIFQSALVMPNSSLRRKYEATLAL